MIIEISEKDSVVHTKVVKGNTMYEQNAYLHFDEQPYPLPFKMSRPNGSSGYAPGRYTFSPNSIRANQYGALEFDRYNMSLIPLSGSDNSAVKDSTTTPPGK